MVVQVQVQVQEVMGGVEVKERKADEVQHLHHGALAPPPGQHGGPGEAMSISAILKRYSGGI